MTSLSSPGEGPWHHRLSSLVGRPLFWILLVATLFALPLVRAVLRPLPKMPPAIAMVPAFVTPYAWTSPAGPKAGAAFDSRELVGRVWLAAFVDPADAQCETLAGALTDVQRRSRNLGDAWRMVSFVPGGVDHVALDGFARRHHPNPLRWLFVNLTPAIEQSFVTAMQRTGLIGLVGAADARTVHAKHLVGLVDRRGRLRGFYDVVDPAGRSAALSDLGLLANLDP